MTAARRGRRLASLLAALLGIGGFLLAGTFAAFLLRSAARPAPPAQADGIVALTGGAGRVETALRLLAEGRAPIAMLSGVGGGAELAELARRAGLDPLPLESRVTLGRTALSTRGNAGETAAWVRDNAIRSLIVVTAAYHMPRALAEMGSAMPEVTLYPVPVGPPLLGGGAGAAREAGMARLIVEEYVKWLLAQVGLSGLGGPGQAARGGGLHEARAGADP